MKDIFLRKPFIFKKVLYQKLVGKNFLSAHGAWLHYIFFSRNFVESPSEFFNSEFYLSQFKFELNGERPFVHYLREGWRKGIWPNPVFDPLWYRENYTEVQRTGEEPLSHYVRKGWKMGFRPNQLIDMNYYLSTHPDVAQSGVNPLFHYLRYGMSEGRRLHPVFDIDWYFRNRQSIVSPAFALRDYLVGRAFLDGASPGPYFDVEWYRRTNPDIALAGVEPVGHYDQHGWREGRDPNPYFHTRWYLAANPDVREGNWNPLYHFATLGDAQGRRPNAQFRPDTPFEGEGALFYRMMTTPGANKSKLGLGFDADYYTANNLGVSIDEALDHYLVTGRAKGFAANAGTADARDDVLARLAAVNQLTTRRRDDLQRRVGDTTLASTPGLLPEHLFDGIRCVSVDIFDTLVERSTGSPITVFDAVAVAGAQGNLLSCDQQASFVRNRIKAETLARNHVRHREITLTEIYRFLREISGLSLQAAQALQAIEEDVELRVCRARDVGRSIFDQMRARGLPVILLSDIYLNAELVRRILDKCGFDGYVRLYVSSQTGLTKHDGDAFKTVLREFRLSPPQLLHIGDNRHSDVDVPERLGIRSVGIRQTKEMLPLKTLRDWYATIPDAGGRWKALTAGAIALNASACERGGTSVQNAARACGLTALAPTLFAFAVYCAQMAMAHGYRRLYFASRDGFYLKEAYDRLRAVVPALPEARYILVSRSATRLAAIESDEDIRQIVAVDHYPASIRDLLSARFSLSDRELKAIVLQCGLAAETLTRRVSEAERDDEFRMLLEAALPMIRSRASDARRHYLKYLEGIGFDGVCDALVDIGYRGTMQSALASITGSRVSGVYFSTWPEVNKLKGLGLKFDSFHRIEDFSSDPLVRHVQLFELFLSATHGTFLGFTSRGTTAVPFLGKPDVSSLTSRTLTLMREQALETVTELADILGPDIVHWNVSTGTEALAPLSEYFSRPDPALVAGLSQHRFEDKFGGEDRMLTASDISNLSFEDALKQSCWREGAARLWTRLRSGKLTIPTLSLPPIIDSFDGFTTRRATDDGLWE